MVRIITIVLVFLVFSFIVVTSVAAQINLNLDPYPKLFGIDLATKEGQRLDNIIAWFYAFVVTISGLAAFAIIVWAGIKWMTSAGSPTATADAKDRIQKALLGLLLILSSVIILQTINPELGSLRIPGLDPVQGTGIGVPDDALPKISINLTANFQKDSISVSPEDEITLRWTVGGSRVCNASSHPDEQLWEGEKSSGSENIGSLPKLSGQSFYTFTLSCSWPDGRTRTEQVRVSVVSKEELKPIVDLKADGQDGPLTYSRQLSRAQQAPRVLFTWNALNVDSCEGNNLLGNLEGKVSGSALMFLDVSQKGEYSYAITCTNTDNEKTAEDTVKVIVK